MAFGIEDDEEDARFYSSPAVANGIVYVSSWGNTLYALDASTGEKRWSFRAVGGHSRASAAVEDGIVYTTSEDGNLYALDALSGDELWRFGTGAEIVASPSVVAGVVYFGSKNNTLYALNARTGREIWSHLTGGNFHPTYTAAVVDDIVYWGPDTFDAATGAPVWADRFRAEGYARRTCSAVVDGTLYAVTSSYLYAIGSLMPIELSEDVVVRGAPSSRGLSRGSAGKGIVVDSVGTPEERNGELWVEVMIGGLNGWIPLDAIDPATLPPEGEIEYVYTPD